MAFVERSSPLMLFFIVLAVLNVSSMATVYKVGDSAGWTSLGHIDYKGWAASKTFHVGDTIVFEYSPQYHNVMQVTYPNYNSCNATPIATYATGNDSITIKKKGHYYYLCGFPQHCQAGQKVDIRVVSADSPSGTTPSPSSPSPSPSLSPSPSPSPSSLDAPAPAPSNSNAVLPGSLAALVFVILAVAGFAY